MSWSEILIHHSAHPDDTGVDRDDFDEWHRARGWRAIGYHFIVERIDGVLQVLAGRPLTWDGSHCPGHNTSAIGVCIAGDFTDVPPDDEMLAFAATFVAGLAVLGGIDVGEIYPHRRFRQTSCPGDSFPWSEFVEDIRVEITRAEVR